MVFDPTSGIRAGCYGVREVRESSPILDGTDFAFWKYRIQAYIEAQGNDVWNKISRPYEVPIPVTNLNKTDVDLNAQARNLLFQGISHKEFDRVAHINSDHLI